MALSLLKVYGYKYYDENQESWESPQNVEALFSLVGTAAVMYQEKAILMLENSRDRWIILKLSNMIFKALATNSFYSTE